MDNDHAGGVCTISQMQPFTFHTKNSIASTALGREVHTSLIRFLTPLNFMTYESTGEKWFDLEARSLQLPDGLEAKLIPLPGHTFGHCGIAYREEGKWSLHAGDAYFDKNVNFLEPAPGLPLEIAFQTSATDRQASLKKLQSLRADQGSEINIFCTHDQQQFADWTVLRGKPDPLSDLIP